MLKKILTKIGVYLLVLLGLSILVFIIARVIPGDPARQALGPRVSEETVQNLRREMNLDKPLVTQYLYWLKGAVYLDLGNSLQTRRPVITDIRQYLPATLEIVLLSALFMIIGGILLGIVSTKYTGKWLDGVIRVLSYLGIVSPSFLWAVLFMLLFGYLFPVLPTTGRISQSMAAPSRIITGMYTIDYLLQGNIAGYLDAIRHIILPAVALMLGGMAQAARLTRGNMVENYLKDYIQAEQAYGVTENRLLFKYLLKPSLIPTITVMAMDIAAIFGNAFLVENIFNYPGLSRYGLSAMLNKDINAISGVVMILGLVFIVLNILSDLIVAWLDPRVRLMGGSEE
ncbi:MAG: ABC transporter permease [Synergistaceae bacterium]|jgi:peptide/nickel transport system permease protein|nr:ABC transporter permease [Synergistaceae bacterium]